MYLRNANSAGAAATSFIYGEAGDTIIFCDWDGNGTQTPGLRRGNTWYLNNGFDSTADVTPFGYGDPADIPLVGNWDGLLSPADGIAVVRNGTYYLTNTFNGAGNAGFVYGNPSDTPLAGDWNGDRFTTIGAWRAGTWYLNDQNDSSAPEYTYTYGNPTGDKPITGNWDGTTTNLDTTPGIIR